MRMVDSLVRALRSAKGVQACSGTGALAPHSRGAPFPRAHVDLLRRVNALSACFGYVRLFGAGCARCTDITSWNAEETWKFAWDRRVSNFLCFGQTGWGDQYAYDLDALRRGDDRVFVLDAFEMEPEEVASTFVEFLNREILGQLERSYDSMTRAALERIGPLSQNEAVTYVPSPLLGVEEAVENVVKMPARTLMVMNGDLATQIATAPDRAIERLVTYEDDQGRMRLRVVWE